MAEDFKTQIIPFGQGTLDLQHPVGDVEPENYARILNVFRRQDGLLTGRLGLTQFITGLPGHGKISSIARLNEQPAVIGDTLNTFINPATGHITLAPELLALADAPRITISACGTAYLAGFVAKYWLEQVARIPVEIDVASEFRYRAAPMPADASTDVEIAIYRLR